MTTRKSPRRPASPSRRKGVALKIPGLKRRVYPATWPLYTVWFKGSWGVFGWRQYRLGARVFFAIGVALGSVLVALAIALRFTAPRHW